MGSEDTVAANPLLTNQPVQSQYPIQSLPILQSALMVIRNISPANGKVSPVGQKTWGAMSVLPEEPERTGRQREYIEDSLVMSIQISGIPSTLPERLLTLGFGLL